MFAYLIIAVEIAILYTVFWYIFVREPKPFRIQGNPWGRYERTANLTDAAQSTPSQPTSLHDWMTVTESAYSRYAGGTVSQFQPLNLSPKGESLPEIQRNPAIKYGWVAESCEPCPQTSRVLLGVQKTFDDLRLRMI